MSPVGGARGRGDVEVEDSAADGGVGDEDSVTAGDGGKTERLYNREVKGRPVSHSTLEAE